MSGLVPCKSTTPCPSLTAAASTAPSPPSAANQSIVPSSCPLTSRASPAPALPPPPPPPCSSHPRRQSRFRCRRAGGSGQFTNICAGKRARKGHNPITKFSILSNYRNTIGVHVTEKGTGRLLSVIHLAHNDYSDRLQFYISSQLWNNNKICILWWECLTAADYVMKYLATTKKNCQFHPSYKTRKSLCIVSRTVDIAWKELCGKTTQCRSVFEDITADWIKSQERVRGRKYLPDLISHVVWTLW